MDEFARFVVPVTIFLIVVFYLVYLINDTIVNYIALIPANTLLANTYIWNLATSFLLETSFVRVVIDITLLIPVLRFDMFTPMDQFALYIVFTVLACSLLTSCWFFYRFFSTGEWDHLTEQVYGYGGIIMALHMFKVLKCPNDQLTINKIIIPYKYFPTLVVGLQVLLWLIGVRFLSVDVSYTSTAYIFCWCYLRYYYHYENNQIGNKSEEFKFIEMYPPVLHPVIIPLSTACYNLGALVGIFPKSEIIDTSKRQTHHLRYDSEPSTPAAAVDPVAERRRAKAMKLLDAKMAKLAQEPEGWSEEQQLDNDIENK